MSVASQNSPLVSVFGLSKSFQEGSSKRDVLMDLSADFAAGAFHVVLGRSGSGKSTLLNLIAGIELPDRGTISIAGEVMNEISEKDRTLLRRRSIGFVFQFFSLIPSLTIEENVLLPLELLKLDKKEQRVREILERMGLEDRRASFPNLLSGGEQQRVAIARAVVHEPQLVLADEPTGNLDDSNASQVIQLLSELTGNSTVIMATHSREVASKADFRWILKSGMLESLESVQ